jgi:peptidoglycan/xylan/chitin deacetylase (PgdA/CDA1 family)
MRPERGGLLAAGLLSAWCGPAAAPVFPPLARLFRIPLRLPDERGVALTFDDGPHAQGTPAVLAALDLAHVRATFFLVGEQVERQPSLAAEIAAAGHEIAIHGYRHRLLLRRSPRALAADFDRAVATIGEATGVESLVYRPPYGVFSLAGLELARRRWQPLLWSRWGRDWQAGATAASVAARVGRELVAGDVVLLHDADSYSTVGSWRATVAALPAIIEAARASGEPLVAVSQPSGGASQSR